MRLASRARERRGEQRLTDNATPLLAVCMLMIREPQNIDEILSSLNEVRENTSEARSRRREAANWQTKFESLEMVPERHMGRYAEKKMGWDDLEKVLGAAYATRTETCFTFEFSSHAATFFRESAKWLDALSPPIRREARQKTSRIRSLWRSAKKKPRRPTCGSGPEAAASASGKPNSAVPPPADKISKAKAASAAAQADNIASIWQRYNQVWWRLSAKQVKELICALKVPKGSTYPNADCLHALLNGEVSDPLPTSVPGLEHLVHHILCSPSTPLTVETISMFAQFVLPLVNECHAGRVLPLLAQAGQSLWEPSTSYAPGEAEQALATAKLILRLVETHQAQCQNFVGMVPGIQRPRARVISMEGFKAAYKEGTGSLHYFVSHPPVSEDADGDEAWIKSSSWDYSDCRRYAF